MAPAATATSTAGTELSSGELSRFCLLEASHARGLPGLQLPVYLCSQMIHAEPGFPPLGDAGAASSSFSD